MRQTNLTINSTNNGQKITDKITYVNPDITDQQALNLAKAFNALTNNTYSSTTRTNIIDLETQINRPITFQYQTTAYSPQLVPADGAIDLPTSKLPTNKSLTLYIITPLDSAPQVSCVDNNPDNPVKWLSSTYYSELGYVNTKFTWVIILASNISTARPAITPRTIDVQIHFNESPKYAACDLTANFNIYDDSDSETAESKSIITYDTDNNDYYF